MEISRTDELYLVITTFGNDSKRYDVYKKLDFAQKIARKSVELGFSVEIISIIATDFIAV